MKRLLAALLLVAAAAAACGESSSPPPTAAPTATPSAGMTLDQEVGAVIMSGFRGPINDSVVADWRTHQFGGLLAVNLSHNAATDAELTSLITTLRGISAHGLVAATDQEGGDVCLAAQSVPCAPMPVGQGETTRMASALHALGFNLDLGPVSDVCSGPSSIMWGRCYGTMPDQVAAGVGPVVDGIHAAGMLSAAKHFPGHGDTSVSSETSLPQIDESLAAIRTRNLPPFAAAIAHQTDLVMLGHLFYPAIDAHRSADLSPATVSLLRTELHFKGAIISDDMQMGAITTSTPTPEAAAEFLIAGGDMVIVAHDLSVANATFDAIKNAVTSGRLPRARLDEAVARLAALHPAA